MLICIVVGMPRQPINRALLKTADWAGMLYASVGFSVLYAALEQATCTAIVLGAKEYDRTDVVPKTLR